MNFSKYKLHLTEGQAVSGGTQASIDTSNKGSEAASMGIERSRTIQTGNKAQQGKQRAQTYGDTTRSNQIFREEMKDREKIKAFENKKSDWRTELQEKVIDGQERENHPYVTVMPTGDENLIQAMKQMGKAIKDKKDAPAGEMKEGVLDDALKADKKVGKLIKDTDKDVKKVRKGGKFNYKEEVEELDEAEKKKKKIVNTEKVKMIRDKSYPRPKPSGVYEEAEEEELVEGKKKKKCKEGYHRDEDGNCVKDKKSRTTIVYGGRWGYGHGHDNSEDENDSDGGDSGGGEGGEGGGMGEMFDALGDLLLEDKARMERMKKEYEAAAKQPSPFDNMTDKQKQQMTKATKPRMGSSD